MSKKVKVFLSHSFAERDKKLVESVKKLLHEETLIERPILESKDVRVDLTVSERIQKDIRKSDLVVGIFSKRVKQASRGAGQYLPPPWVIAECSFAMGAGIAVFPIVQDGVLPKATAFVEASGIQLPIVQPRIPHDQFLELKAALTKLIQKEQADSSAIRQLSFSRKIKPRSTGITVENHVTAEIRDPINFGGFMRSIRLRSGRGPIRGLSIAGMSTAYPASGAPYLAALASSSEPDHEVGPMDIRPLKSRDPDRRWFTLHPRFPITRGQLVHYEYEWRLPVRAWPLSDSSPSKFAADFETREGPIVEVELLIELMKDTKLSKSGRPTCNVVPHTGPSGAGKPSTIEPERRPRIRHDQWEWSLQRYFFGTAVIEWIQPK